jgi:hypothetical protein
MARQINKTILKHSLLTSNVYMGSHTHYWHCSDVPAVFNCECGAESYFDRETQTYTTVEAGK